MSRPTRSRPLTGCTDNDLAILTISEALRRIDAIDLRVYPAWGKGMQSYIADVRALLAAHEQRLAQWDGKPTN